MKIENIQGFNRMSINILFIII